MNILTATVGLVVAVFGAAESTLGDPTQSGNLLSRIIILERTVSRHSLELTEIRSKVSEIVRGRRMTTDYTCITEKTRNGRNYLTITCPSKFQNKDVLISKGNLFVYSGVSEGINGKGNIVVGATKINKKTHPGSHNVMVGESNTYTSYGGFVAGFQNTISAPHATVTGGSNNTSSGTSSSIAGGELNIAIGTNSAVSGGSSNEATGYSSSVNGGKDNVASNSYSAVNGGINNTASGFISAVNGGRNNTASGEASAVNGGRNNTASGAASAVNGGFKNEGTGSYSAANGGRKNTASGYSSAVNGGVHNAASGLYSTVIGGYYSAADEQFYVNGNNIRF